MTRYESLAVAVRRAARADPAGLAVADGLVRWTWRELNQRVESVALGLTDAGVEAGDRVVVLVAPTAPAVAALHAIARIGAIAAPLDTRLTAVELVSARAVVDPLVVVHDDRHAVSAAVLPLPLLGLEDLMSRQPGPGLPADGTASTLPAAIVLTSGTTGGPKAAILSVAALVASAEAWLAVLPPATGWLLALGLGHVAGLGVMWRAALSGVPLVLAQGADADLTLAALRADPGPSHVSLVPTQLTRLLDLVADGPPPATLRAVLLGGGVVPATLVRRAILAGWPVVPTYGLTEAGSGVTALPTSEAGAHAASAGRPLPGVELRIGEPDHDGVGEIEVRSASLFSGYLADAKATAAVLGGDGWLRTGDLGHLDRDGRLTVHDRRTDRIVRGGENVSPLEVENVLLENAAVADAAVVARRHEIWGQVPVAVIVLRAGAVDPGDGALAAHCRRRLAGFKVPVAFVRLEAMPRTSTGKLQRAAVRAGLDAGDADAALPGGAVMRTLRRPGGARLSYRRSGTGPVPLLLLHATLSTSAQLRGLAGALADFHEFTILAVDREGSGESRLAEPEPLPVQVHVDDLIAVLDAEGCRAAALVGLSFGGVVALEFAARMPSRTLAVVAWEPPYGPLADAVTRRAFADVATSTDRAYREGGSALAAETFMRGVAGPDSWERLGDRARSFLAAEGGGARVDAALTGLDPDGLARIDAPVILLTGDASESFYGPVADVLASRIRDGRRVRLPGLAHAGPVTDQGRFARAVVHALQSAGTIPPKRPVAVEPG